MILNFLSSPVFLWLNHKRPPQEIPLSNFDRICEEIQSCDILLIEGRSRVSDVIKLITQSPWSHAALYVGRISEVKNSKLRELLEEHYPQDSDAQLIIESELGMGTIIRPLDAYRQEHIRICRPKGLMQADADDIIRYALSCIGYQYDVRQILDLARFLFPWHFLPRRWRSSLFIHNMGDTTKTVCSTMIAEAFNFVQFPILPLVKSDDNNNLSLYRRNPKLCVPRDFDYSPYFEIIKYPFIDHGQYKGYHQLPWRGTFDSELSGLNTHVQQVIENDDGDEDATCPMPAPSNKGA